MFKIILIIYLEKNNREAQRKKRSSNETVYKEKSHFCDSNNDSENKTFITYEFEAEKNNLLESLPNLKSKSIVLVLLSE